MKPGISEAIIHYILRCTCHELSELDRGKMAVIFNVSEGDMQEAESYITHEKIHRAIRFIEQGSENDCAELASKLGFRDVAGFRESFKRMFLVDPETYIYLRKCKNRPKPEFFSVPLRISSKQRYIYA